MFKILLILTAVFCCFTFTNALCPGFCVMRTSAYWKSQVLSHWNTDVHYFVCRFAEDARNKCNAEWENCVDNYVYVRQIFDAFTFRGPIIALHSGRDGFFGKGCNRYLLESSNQDELPENFEHIRAGDRPGDLPHVAGKSS